MRSSFLRFVVCAMVALFLGGAVALAQLESGQIAGTILDQSGAVVTNATVVVKNVDTNAVRNTVSSSTGSYQVPGLTPGHYLVTVTSANFKPYSAKVEVTVGAHVTLDAKLSVSSSVTQIQVVAEGGVEVNTQTQELSQVIDTQQMQQLPSLTRDPYDFVGLSGNVSAGDGTGNTAGGGGQNLTTRGVGYAINGQRETGTEILLDGVENIAVFSVGVGEDVPIDAVQEYSVITNNYSAEFGRASGGVVNVSTKAGTNKFHGSAWEYNRLSAYTANTFGNDAANWASLQSGGTATPKGTYTRNQFGFQVTGPAWKNKLFFAVTDEFTRVRSSAQESEEVFDPAFIAMLPANAKNYFGTYGTGVSSTTVGATAGNLASPIPASTPYCFFGGTPPNCNIFPDINGVTPVPQTVGGADTNVFDTINFKVPFNAGGGNPQNTYELVGRADYNPTDKTQMFFRFGRESQDLFVGTNAYTAYAKYDSGTAVLNQSYLYSVSHTFSTNLFASLKASFTRFNTPNSFDTTLTDTPNLMFVTPTDPYSGANIAMPGLENTSSPGNGGLPYGGPQNTIQVEPDISWTKGTHSMRFGGLYTYLQENQAYGAYAQAVEQLGTGPETSMEDLINMAGNPGGSQLAGSSGFTARVNANGVLPCVANPSFWSTASSSDLQLTSGCQVTPPLSSANYARSYRYKDGAIYGQDSWRLTPKFTFNYGLRWEHYGVQRNNNQNLDSNFYFGTGTGIEAQTRSGQVDIADKSPAGGFWKPRWGTFAPRVGFAYDLTGNGRTSIRGGIGASYERNFGNVTFNASFNPPASAVLSTTCPPNTPTCNVLVTNDDLGPLGLSTTPASPLPPSELRMPNPNMEVAQTQFWSLALQHQLARSTVVQATYSGAHSVHLYDIENINQLGAGQVYLGDPLTFSSDADCPVTPVGGFDEFWISDGATEPCFNRPNNQYSAINMRGSMGTGAYESLNLGVQSNNLYDTGLSFVTNYTWGHSLDDASSTFGDSLQGGSGAVGSLGYTDLMHPKVDWGSSDYDIRQRLTVSPIWATPWFKTNGTQFERETLGNWTLSGIFTARTGSPFSVFDEDNLLVGYTIPRLTPSTAITQYKTGTPKASDPINAPNQFSALSIPAPAGFVSDIEGYAPLNTTLGISDLGPFPAGMTHRNAFRGPGAWNLDLDVEKRFPLTDKAMLTFRAEGFNVLNHHNYYVNTTTLIDVWGGNAATPTPALSPLSVTEEKGGLGNTATGGNNDERRFGQFSLRLSF